ncbi:hypothetical protein CYMTET_42895 [Cymbomonas tetramitiformis]|uniref:BED-type domain-containing protein n=1 Tax=Cymbomonas tetramitiformis TaxID=36881 RepID=A0AAE0F0J5_9CHLO|nr:hypothetical protein CYMTET_42895 [Cymbomonas tetramitiformis]
MCKTCGEPGSVAYSGNTSSLRSHLSHVHTDLFCKLVSKETEEVTSSDSTPKMGTLQAMLPPVSEDRRDELHKKFALWIVRNNRPLTIGEHDVELRDIFDYIFQGSYIPPTYKLVVQNILKLSVMGKDKAKAEIAKLKAEGILPSIAGDIWLEGGIAIFGILVYWLTPDFEYVEKLLAAIPFGEVRHTAKEMELATKRASADIGIGVFVESEEGNIVQDTVVESIHATASDSASNIVKSWEVFGGHECSCHTLALSLGTFMESEGVKSVFVKLRGMTTHFNHSVIGRNLLHDCQRKYSLRSTSPPQDTATRGAWKGSYLQADWYTVNQEAVQIYDVEQPQKAATAVDNPDGSKYRDHKLQLLEWDVVKEASYVLAMTSAAIDILQSTSIVTVSLILPVVGRLTYKLEEDTPVRHGGRSVKITVVEVLHRFAGVQTRGFCCGNLFGSSVYKALDFKNLSKWNKGTLTAEAVITWARDAYEADWKPKSTPPTVAVAPVPGARKSSKLVDFLE